MDYKTTFVTGFYSCNEDMDVKAYFRKCMRTLSAPVPLIIFCEKAHEEFFLGTRKLFGLDAITHVKTIPLTELFFYQFKDQVDKNRELYWPTRDPRVNSVSHLITLSKFQFMRDAMNLNPFHTSHFGWMDINLLNKLCNNSLNYLQDDIYDKLRDICCNPKPKVCIEVINCWKPEDYSNLREFYSSYRWIVAGCFWTTELEVGQQIVAKLIAKSVEITNLGFGHGEEAMFSYIIDENEDSFHLYIGDYQDTLHNYYRPVSNLHYVNQIIEIYKSRQHFQRLQAILSHWR